MTTLLALLDLAAFIHAETNTLVHLTTTYISRHKLQRTRFLHKLYDDLKDSV